MLDSASLWTILQIAGLGGVVAALAKWLLDLITDRMKRSSDAAYVGLRAVILLERFTAACEAHVLDRDVLQQRGGVERAGVLPMFGEFPANIEWRHFNRDLALAVLGLPAAIEAAQGACYRAEWEADNYWQSETEAIRLGLHALELARRVRSAYRLGRNEQNIGGELYHERDRRAEAKRRAEEREQNLAAERAAKAQETAPPVAE